MKKEERKLKTLNEKAIVADSISSICVLDSKIKELEQKICDNGQHHVRPSVSEFFSGRHKELRTIEGILGKRRSAVIMEYGGAGKKELMIAFAYRAEQDC